MTQYPESGVKLFVDTKEYTSSFEQAIALAEQFDSFGSLTLDVSADVDMSALDEIQDLPLDDQTVNFTVDTTLTGDDLPQTGDVVNEDVNIAAKAADEDSKGFFATINDIKEGKPYQMVIDIAGTALDFLKAFEQFAVEPLLDVDDAVAKITAQTGELIPGIREIVSGIRYDDLGDSFDQIADIVIKAKQMGAPFEEATRSALLFTHTFTDQNPLEVLDTMNAMVTNKLVPNYEEASDLLTVAFQNNANRGGDLLSTIQKNATAFHDLGLDGKTALGNIIDGLNKGFTSADQVANVFTKIKQNVQNAAGNDTSAVTQQLEKLGIPNPAEAGTAWGIEFVAKVIKGIQEAPVSDAEKEKMLGDILGDKFTGKAFSALMQMSPEEAADVFVNTKGAAGKAALEIDSSLRGAVADFLLAAEQAATKWLSSAAIDLPGKIAALKEGLQGALDVLAKGGSLSDALTIALKPVGLDATFQSLESAMGNFLIGILQAVSAIQATMPDQWEAKKGTDAAIANLGQGQLTYDLKVGNADELSGEVATAVSRGVTPEKIAESVSTAVEELVKSGAIAQAQALLDEFTNSAPNLQVAQGLNGEQLTRAQVALREGGSTLGNALEEGIVVNITPNLTPEAEDVLQKQINDATTVAKTEAVKLLRETRLAAADAADELTPTTDALKTSATTAAPAMQATADATRQVGTEAKAVYGPVQNTAGALDSVTGSAIPTTDALFGVGGALDAITSKATAFNTAAGAATDRANAAVPTTATGGSGSSAPVPTNTLSGGSITSALMPFIPGSSTSNGGGSSYTAINNNIVQSEAQADALGYRTAAQLRGMAGG